MRVSRKKGAIVLAQTGFEAQAVERLKQSGHRVTLPRVQVVRVLANADQPFTAYGIHQEIVSNGGRIDVVTVYRVIHALSTLGLIHHIGVVDGYMACRLDDAHDTEAEHVVCTECGKVTELQVPEEVLRTTGDQLTNLGFRPRQTRVEILAVCPECAN